MSNEMRCPRCGSTDVECHPKPPNRTHMHECHSCGYDGTTPLAQQYRKKPVVIEAMQWDGTAECATPIINWILAGDSTARYVDYVNPSYKWIAINTLEGEMRCDQGDWVIRGIKGEFYPCKPDIFEATYESLATHEIES